MNILLIKQPTLHFRNTAPPISGIPLGLLYVAASLKKCGHDVRIYDAIVDAGENRWGFRESVDTIRMGATWDEIKRVIEQHRPDAVGISNQYSSQAAYAIKTAEAVKQVCSSIKIIIGGPHATVEPSAFLYRNSPVDYAVLGEGELSIAELADTLSGRRDIKTIQGIAYLDDGKLILNPRRAFLEELDRMPFPAYELLDLERYFYFNAKGKDGRETYNYRDSHRSVSMITSRGCPFNCIFCSIQLVMGHRFRAHSAEFVLEHIRLLKEKYNVRHIHFEDDNMSFDIPRFKHIVEGMIENKFNITWDTPNGVRADFLDEDILKKCKASGCTYLRIGVESADEYVSKEIIRKHLDPKKIIEITRLCKKIGIDLEAFYIIGFPGEKIPQMNKTIHFAITQARAYGMYPYDMFTATPLIGTQLYSQAKAKGYLSKDISFNNLAQATQGEGMITTEDFAPADLKRLLRFFRIRRNIAMALYFLRFLIAHPAYIFIRLNDSYFRQNEILLLKQFKIANFLIGLFMYRYKNCVMRKIGIT